MSDKNWVPAYWSNELVGKTIKITNGENVLIGTYETEGKHHFVGKNLVHLPINWQVFVEAPALPTEPGYYFDKNGDEWQFKSHQFPLGPYVAVDAPFTRLEPVAETANKVLDRVTEWYAEGESRSLPSYIDALRAEFGA